MPLRRGFWLALFAAGIGLGCSRGLADAGDDASAEASTDAREPAAGQCTPPPGEEMTVVCFGADPDPYQRYLAPGDAGPSPGQCPAVRDFVPVRGEACGYVSCGPLPASTVAEQADGGVGDAGTDCCFFVSRVCGV